MKVEDKIKELQSNGITVWSFSRLSSFLNCEYEYYNTYVLRNKGIDNVYTSTGSFMHNFIESYYKGKKDKSAFTTEFHEQLSENELLGLDFPNEQIKDNFIKDVTHFTENFKKLDGKFLLEQQIVFKVGEYYIRGFIDAIQVVENEDGEKEVNVIDWKTSSKFIGKKLNEAGRQLLLYKLGLESSTKANVNKVMWAMIKYLYVCHVQKNGKTKRKMCNRGKWVKEMKSTFEKEMLKGGLDELEVDILMEQAINENSIEHLPNFIKDKYWLEDCYVEYEVSEEKIQELNDYVNSTIEAINSKDKNNPDEWKPLDFEKESFYCNNLCGHRKHCKFRKEYISNANFERKEKEVSLDDLFS